MRSKRNGKRLQAFLLCMLLLYAACPVRALAKPLLGEARGEDGISQNAAYLLIDEASGEILAESNADTPYAHFGGGVRWMSALVALDHLSFSDMTEAVRRYDEGLGEDEASIGIRRGRVYSIRDLTAAMLLPGAADAALMLRNLTVQELNREAGYVEPAEEEEEYPGDFPGEAVQAEEFPAGAPYNEASFVQLMNEKAVELGMEQTHYTNVDGAYDEAQTTSARDQLILLESLLEHKLLAKLASQESYTLESAEAGISSFRTAYGLMNRQSASYDARVKTMSKGVAEAGTQCALLAQSGSVQLMMAFWSPGSGDAQSDERVLQALDSYMALQRLNILGRINELAADVELIAEDAVLREWTAADRKEFLCFAQPDFDLDAELLELDIAEESLIQDGDGAWQAYAQVLYDGVNLGGILLCAEAKQGVAMRTASGAHMEIYPSQPVPEPETWVEEYMWLLVIGAAAILAVLAYIAGYILRERMER